MPRTSHWIVRRLSHLDGILLTLVLVLLGISLAVVASASGQSPARISGHLINMGLARGVMVVMANVPPHLLSRVGPPLFVAGVVLLTGGSGQPSAISSQAHNSASLIADR